MKILWLLDRYSVRDECVKNDFYNFGNNRDYENMLSKVEAKKDGFTAEEVAEIAQDITVHTGGKTFEFVYQRLLNRGCIIVK